MNKKDNSREIFEKYYNSKRVLKIKLKDGSVLEGILVGFFHGSEGEPYIIKWHLVDKNEVSEYKAFGTFEDQESGKIINQEDIVSVDFK